MPENAQTCGGTVVADSEPDRYATYREFADPSDEDAGRRLSHETQREGSRAIGKHRDPRRTYHEEPGQPDGQDPRRTYWEGSGPAWNSGSGTGGSDEDASDGDGPIMGLPPALRPRYMVLRELPNPGSEADVLLVRENAAPDDTDRKVVKIYRRGVHADPVVWAKVRELSSENIARFIETGTSGGRDYEVMEYVPGGNLAKLAAAEAGAAGRRCPGGQAGQPRLAELHRHGIVHRDLKPENILVRRADPLDVVVTDFGLAKAPEQSVVAASRTGTLAYLAPETLLSKGAQSSKARDWWALGMIVRDLLTGSRAFTDMTEAGIVQSLGLRPVDLGAVTDPRAHLLCRGLLLRDPAQRWGAEQVSEWLAGGTPAVADEPVAEAAGIKPITFQAVAYQDRKALALALGRSWDLAVPRYFADENLMGEPSAWRELQAWLEQFRDTYGSDLEELYALIDDQLLSRSVAPDVKLLLLIQWLNPELPPVYRGRPMDRGNLAALAEHMVVAPESEPGLNLLITDLRRHNLLPALARMRGGGGLAEVSTRWRQLNGRFGQLALAARGLPAAAPGGDGRGQPPPAGSPALPRPGPAGARGEAGAHHQPARPHARAGPVVRPHPGRGPEPTEPAGRPPAAPLVPAGRPRLDRGRPGPQGTRGCGPAQQGAWTEQERQRLAGAPGLARAMGYSGIIAGVMLIMFIATLPNVHSVANDMATVGWRGRGGACLRDRGEPGRAARLRVHVLPPDGGPGTEDAARGNGVHGAGAAAFPRCPSLRRPSRSAAITALRGVCHHRRSAARVLDGAAESWRSSTGSSVPRSWGRVAERGVRGRSGGRGRRYRCGGADWHGRGGELRFRRRPWPGGARLAMGRRQASGKRRGRSWWSGSACCKMSRCATHHRRPAVGPGGIGWSGFGRSARIPPPLVLGSQTITELRQWCTDTDSSLARPRQARHSVRHRPSCVGPPT